MKVPPASSPAAREEQLSQQRQIVSAGPQLKNRQETIRGKAPAVTTPPTQDLENALGKINRASEAMNLSLRFKLHDKTDRVMVEVVDVEENVVLKEIPPEKVLNMVAQIQDMIGLMLDAKR